MCITMHAQTPHVYFAGGRHNIIIAMYYVQENTIASYYNECSVIIYSFPPKHLAKFSFIHGAARGGPKISPSSQLSTCNPDHSILVTEV